VEHTVACKWSCDTATLLMIFMAFVEISSFKEMGMYGDSSFENYVTFSDFMMHVLKYCKLKT